MPFEPLPRALNLYFHCRIADIFSAHSVITLKFKSQPLLYV